MSALEVFVQVPDPICAITEVACPPPILLVTSVCDGTSAACAAPLPSLVVLSSEEKFNSP